MVIAVGGSSRKAGKTAVICALIRALPDAGWTAIKVSPHAHTDAGGGDTARFLAAGAKSALLLRAVPAEWPAGNVVVESGSVRKADIYLLVVDTSCGRFKRSARELMSRADAFVVTGGEWDGGGRPIFYAQPPLYESADLVDYLRARLVR